MSTRTPLGTLWNISHHQMIEARQMHDFVEELAVSTKSGTPSNLVLRESRMPEESSTVAFARRLAVGFQGLGAAKVTSILHTRALEGGTNRGGINGSPLVSKADIQLDIRYSEKYCLRLVLQAKSLRRAVGAGGKAKYVGWSPSSNRTLINWASRHKQTPGMLLYNDSVPEILATAPGDPFGACARATRLNSNFFGRALSIASGGNSQFPTGTPGGISLVLDSAMLTGKTDPMLDDIKNAHFPIEHLLHVHGCTSVWEPPEPASSASGGSNAKAKGGDSVKGPEPKEGLAKDTGSLVPAVFESVDGLPGARAYSSPSRWVEVVQRLQGGGDRPEEELVDDYRKGGVDYREVGMEMRSATFAAVYEELFGEEAPTMPTVSCFIDFLN